MSNAPTETPNVVIGDPKVRSSINSVLSIAGIVLGAAVVLDAASPAFEWAAYTTPGTAVLVFLSGVFGVAVIRPNIPKL